MRALSLGFLSVLLAFTASTAWAQQAKPAEAPRAPVALDAAAIRRQAAQMAEFKALLADPDPNVRLLAMREAIRSGDVAQREMATEAGLASNETAMVSVALSGLLVNIQEIVLQYVDQDGKLVTKGPSSLVLHVSSFEQDSGIASGTVNSSYSKTWKGQIKGNAFSFSTDTSEWSGTLLWSSDTGDFRGRINVTSGREDGIRSAVWKVR